MNQFETWFTEGGRYLLPDGTSVIARYCEIGGQQRWWLVELNDQGRSDRIAAAVYPDGSVWNFIPEPGEHYPGVFIPQRSDLSIADLRPTSHEVALPEVVPYSKRLFAALWGALTVERLWDLSGPAVAWLI